MGKIIIKSVFDNGQRNGGTSIFEFVFQYQIQDVTKQNGGWGSFLRLTDSL